MTSILLLFMIIISRLCVVFITAETSKISIAFYIPSTDIAFRKNLNRYENDFTVEVKTQFIRRFIVTAVQLKAHNGILFSVWETFRFIFIFRILVRYAFHKTMSYLIIYSINKAKKLPGKNRQIDNKIWYHHRNFLH